MEPERPPPLPINATQSKKEIEEKWALQFDRVQKLMRERTAERDAARLAKQAADEAAEDDKMTIYYLAKDVESLRNHLQNLCPLIQKFVVGTPQLERFQERLVQKIQNKLAADSAEVTAAKLALKEAEEDIGDDVASN